MYKKDRNLLLLIVVLIVFAPYIGALLIGFFIAIMVYFNS